MRVASRSDHGVFVTPIPSHDYPRLLYGAPSMTAKRSASDMEGALGDIKKRALNVGQALAGVHGLVASADAERGQGDSRAKRQALATVLAASEQLRKLNGAIHTSILEHRVFVPLEPYADATFVPNRLRTKLLPEQERRDQEIEAECETRYALQAMPAERKDELLATVTYAKNRKHNRMCTLAREETASEADEVKRRTEDLSARFTIARHAAIADHRASEGAKALFGYLRHGTGLENLATVPRASVLGSSGGGGPAIKKEREADS